MPTANNQDRALFALDYEVHTLQEQYATQPVSKRRYDATTIAYIASDFLQINSAPCPRHRIFVVMNESLILLGDSMA